MDADPWNPWAVSGNLFRGTSDAAGADLWYSRRGIFYRERYQHDCDGPVHDGGR